MVQIQRPLTNNLCNITMISTVRCTLFTHLIHLVLVVSLSLLGLCRRIHLPIVLRPDTRSILLCSAIIYCSSPFPPSVPAAFIFFSLPVCFPSTVFLCSEV